MSSCWSRTSCCTGTATKMYNEPLTSDMNLRRAAVSSLRWLHQTKARLRFQPSKSKDDSRSFAFRVVQREGFKRKTVDLFRLPTLKSHEQKWCRMFRAAHVKSQSSIKTFQCFWSFKMMFFGHSAATLILNGKHFSLRRQFSGVYISVWTQRQTCWCISSLVLNHWVPLLLRPQGFHGNSL